MDDHLLAHDLAGRAGDRLLALREQPDVLDVRAAGDRSSHEFLAAELASARSADAVLSEEAVDDRSRLAADRVWIVDPLDGTREYGEPGRTDWAVHVALWERGELTAGAVALPAQGRVLSTAEVPTVPAADAGRIRIAVSRTRAPLLVTKLAELVDGELMQIGSAGAKVAAVMLGQVDAYVHAGGQYEWDSAAPVAVARAAGLHTSRLDGSPLRYNQPDPLLPDLVVCRPELAETLLDGLARVDR
ncbi:MAG: 3'(2'),5'-bisphosphate nucleotidase CysQ [Sporichthyaceae bacterium]|nr:3'(2'),5'-bisphosphate nucleotidase CysQ [Sporichthyaceae bacterium]